MFNPIAIFKAFFVNRLVIALISSAGTYVATTFQNYHQAFCTLVQ